MIITQIKKIFFNATLLFVIPTLANATHSSNESNFYCGLFSGIVFWHNSEKLSVTQSWGPYPGQTFDLPSSPRKKIGWSGGGVVGLSHIFINDIVLNCELSCGFDGISSTKTKKIGLDTESYVINEKFGYTFGLSFMPGYQVVKKLQGFLKIGCNLDQFRIVNNIAGNFAPSGRHSKWAPAFSCGGAVKFLLTECWHLRVEYDFIDYAHFNIKGDDYPPYTPGAAAGPVTSKNNMHSNKFFLTLIYQMPHKMQKNINLIDVKKARTSDDKLRLSW